MRHGAVPPRPDTRRPDENRNAGGRVLGAAAPIVFREVGLLVLWLLSAPFIDNYIAIEGVFQPVWYTSIGLGHLFRLFVLLRVFHTPPPLRWIYRAAGFPMAALWGLILCGELRIINPHYPLLVVAAGLIAGGLHAGRRLHGIAINALFICLIALCVRYGLLYLLGIYLALYALFALGGILFGRNIYRPPAWVAAMAVMTLLTAFLLFHFRFVTGERTERVSTHPAVERLFTYEDSDPVGRRIGRNIMVIQEVCGPDRYLIGSHHGGSGLVLVDREKNAILPSPSIGQCSNDILVDCDRREVVAGAFGKPGGLFFMDLEHWPKQTRPPLSIPGKVVYIVRDEAAGAFLVFPEDQVLLAVDAHSGAILGSLRGPDERAYDHETRELTVLTEPDFSIMRLALSTDGHSPFKVLGRVSLGVPLYKRLQMYFHPGPAPGTTLVTSLWEGTVTLYGRDLKPLRRKRIAPGISGMALTPDKRFLFVGGYTDGNLYVMDMEKWEVVARLYLGHRMRELRLSEDGRRLYVGTSQGGFRIHVRRLLGGSGVPQAQVPDGGR